MIPAVAGAGQITPFGWNVAVARLYERPVDAAEQATASHDVAGRSLLAVVERHAPVRPGPEARLIGVSRDLFAADGLPACQGCDRAAFAPAREPSCPCRTTRHLVAHLLPGLVLDDEVQAWAAGVASPARRPRRSAGTWGDRSGRELGRASRAVPGAMS